MLRTLKDEGEDEREGPGLFGLLPTCRRSLRLCRGVLGADEGYLPPPPTPPLFFWPEEPGRETMPPYDRRCWFWPLLLTAAGARILDMFEALGRVSFFLAGVAAAVVTGTASCCPEDGLGLRLLFGLLLVRRPPPS